MPTTAPRIGMTFTPEMPPERLRPLAILAEESGLDELWCFEDCFKEGSIATVTAALAVTSRIRVGIGLVPVPLRNVALVSMEIATVERLFPGRFIPGIGHGVLDWMGQAGVRAESPLTLLREYQDALRRLLAGEEVTVDGRYVRLDHVKLTWPPAPPPPIWMGGTGPKTLTLAAETADGVLLTDGFVPDHTRLILAAARAIGRPDPEMLLFRFGATGPNAQARVDAAVEAWGGKPGPECGISGDAETIAASIRAAGALGVTSVSFQVTELDDVDGFVRFLGNEVRPLLAG